MGQSKSGWKVITKDIVKSVESQIPKMKEEGADVIVVLAHTGMGDEQSGEMEENATYDLTKVEGIDAIITGHNHQNFPGDFNGTTRCEPTKRDH